MQFDSDDELAAEEEEEALRLQREHAAKLQRSHFGLADAAADADDGESNASGDDVDGTLQQAAEVRCGSTRMCLRTLFICQLV